MAGEWKRYTIDQLKADSNASIAIGPFGSRMKSDTYVPSGVPVIRGNNISDTRAFVDEFVFITPDFADELKSQNVTDGDLVFPHRGNIGTVGIVGDAYPRYVLSTSLMKLTCNRSLVDPLFLFYFFRSPVGYHELIQRASTVGTPGIGTPLTSLRSIPVNLPPLDQQHAIASILGSFDDKIESNRRMNRTLEAIARAVFKSWFVDFDPVRAKADGRTPAGMDAATAALFSDHFGDSDLGKIPAGWRTVSFGSIVKLLSGGTPSKSNPAYWNGSIPWLSAKDMKSPRILDTEDHLSLEGCENGTRLVEAGTILILVRGMTLHNDVPICWATRSLTFNQDVKAVVTELKQHREYVYLWLLDSKLALMGLVDAASHGTGRIHTDLLTKQVLIIPPHDVLDGFNSIIRPLLERATVNDHESRTLAALRDTLLPKLISGKLRIPDAARLVRRAT